MLAQNFMTAETLGITDEEQAALITVLGMLERGELKFFKSTAAGLPPAPILERTLGFFSMNWWGNRHKCGTVMCIGGTAETVMGRTFKQRPDALDDLFWPPENNTVSMANITIAQAASALRNYLTLGEARWAEVLG